MTTNKPEVKRYTPAYSVDSVMRGHLFMEECERGAWVSLEDYEALQVECDTLEQRFDELADSLSLAAKERMKFQLECESLQAECEKLRKDAERYVPLNEAVQRAATELPEGWEIQLCVMRDSGWVDLIGPDGTEDFATDNERLDYTVIDALEFAIDAAMQRDNP